MFRNPAQNRLIGPKPGPLTANEAQVAAVLGGQEANPRVGAHRLGLEGLERNKRIVFRLNRQDQGDLHQLHLVAGIRRSAAYHRRLSSSVTLESSGTLTITGLYFTADATDETPSVDVVGGLSVTVVSGGGDHHGLAGGDL